MEENSEIFNLLKELQQMASEKKTVPNTKETWEHIGNGDWEAAGFSSLEDMQQFIIDNPYLNI